MYQGEEEQEEEGKCGKVGVGNDSIHVPSDCGVFLI